jgi:hypothetical protein
VSRSEKTSKSGRGATARFVAALLAPYPPNAHRPPTFAETNFGSVHFFRSSRDRVGALTAALAPRVGGSARLAFGRRAGSPPRVVQEVARLTS